jgi:16S rRNA (adenine1518-N6/adenine1519-N6)-dimethyltransferase
LKDESIAKAIADTINLEGYEMFWDRSRNGSANKIFVRTNPLPYVIEIDTESVDYLDANYPKDKIISKDFLRYDINEVFQGKQFAIIGNFPYNISTQIVLKP